MTISKKSELTWKISKIRNYSGSNLFRNYVKYENSLINFQYLDETNKSIGGKVSSLTTEYNLSQLKIYNFNDFGYFNNEKIVLGRFKDKLSLNDENSLFDITKGEIENTNLIFRQTYEIDHDGYCYYKFEVNPMLNDYLHEDCESSHTELVPKEYLNLKDVFYHYLP